MYIHYIPTYNHLHVQTQSPGTEPIQNSLLVIPHVLIANTAMGDDLIASSRLSWYENRKQCMMRSSCNLLGEQTTLLTFGLTKYYGQDVWNIPFVNLLWQGNIIIILS